MMSEPARRTDRLLGHAFAYDCRIGVFDFERAARQRLTVDFVLDTDFRRAATTDSVADAIDYSAVNEALAELCRERQWQLIETVAEDMARLLCERFGASAVRVRVTKQPFGMPNIGGVSVECERRAADFTPRHS